MMDEARYSDPAAATPPCRTMGGHRTAINTVTPAANLKDNSPALETVFYMLNC